MRAQFAGTVVFEVDLEIQKEFDGLENECVAGVVGVSWGNAFLAKRIRQAFILQGFQILMLT